MAWRPLLTNPWVWLLFGLAVTVLAYSPGLTGGWLFDDYPNIVDNGRLHAKHWSLTDLLAAALSSPSSEWRRPLASLTFAINILISGPVPAAMKATNLAIHLLNGLVAFLVLRLLLAGASRAVTRRDGLHAAIIATAWMLLPINLTAVLYIVQRMESLANLFVLLGLWGYLAARRSMMIGQGRMAFAIASLLAGTVTGLLAKETAILTPLYAFIAELVVFRFRRSETNDRPDRRVVSLFLVILVIPGLLGLAKLAPVLTDHAIWATRPFTLSTRLLSELRIVLDYVAWTFIPGPSSLSFHHDDFVISTGWLAPWTTLASAAGLLALLCVAGSQIRRGPLVTLGIAWFFGCHLLTATVIPLELIYEHRNYFASLGLLLAALAALGGYANPDIEAAHFRVGPGVVMVAMALCYWTGLTAYTATRWADPLTLAKEFAIRAPESPRAQYELGRAYIIASRYDPQSPFRPATYRVLERAATLPGASILPEQALVFFNAKMSLQSNDAWWASMRDKLVRRTPTVEDESALIALTSCAVQHGCRFSIERLGEAFGAALSHPAPHGRLLAAYADYQWQLRGDKAAAYTAARQAVEAEPSEPVYRTNLGRLAIANHDRQSATRQLDALSRMNVGGLYDADIATLRKAIDAMPHGPAPHE